MALALRSTDNVVFSLTAREQEILSYSWEFFSSLLSGRWTVEDQTHDVPFSGQQVERFLSLVRGQRPHYTEDLDKTCEYFASRDGSWLLSTILPDSPSLALYRRVGLAGCRDVNPTGICHCCSMCYSGYFKHSLPRPFVDKYAIMGLMAHVTIPEGFDEVNKVLCTSLVSACKELGDEYYEAYFAIRPSSLCIEGLVTYDRIKTLLRYHYEYSKAKYGDSTKLAPETLPGGTRETELAFWTTSGGCLCSKHEEVALTCLHEDLIFYLRIAMESLLIEFSTETANISKWLQVYRLRSDTMRK